MNSRPEVAVLLTDTTRAKVLSPQAAARLAGFADVTDARGEPDTWDLERLLAGARACVTGWGTPPLPQDLLDACPELELVAHTAGSVRRLVADDLVGTRVRVSQSAALIANSVAEMTVLQMLISLRHLHLLDRELRSGQPWAEVVSGHPGGLLRARTVGIVSASRTGRAVIELLRGFGCRLLVHDPFLTARDAGRLGVSAVELDELLAESDIVSLHAPVLPETIGMIGRRELGLLRDGSILINSGRAALIDSEALRTELTSGRLRAALDVFPGEPLDVDSPWRDVPSAVLSPHIAGQTTDAYLLQGEAMVDEIARLLDGAPLHYEVTADQARRLA